MKGVRGIKIRFLRTINPLSISLGLYDDMRLLFIPVSVVHQVSTLLSGLAFCKSGVLSVELWRTKVNMGSGTAPCSHSAPPLIVWTWTG